MKILLIFALAAIGAHGMSVLGNIKEQWEAYKLKHDKQYADASEDENRMKIFTETLHEIVKHNELYEKGLVSYKLKVNKWADLLRHELAIYGFRRSNVSRPDSVIMFSPPANVPVPESIDWRKLGAVTPVKDQGQCASCWAFSVTGALEGQHFRKTNKLVSLSEQNLIDCSKNDHGCIGGDPRNAFSYIERNGGIDTEDSYPYEEKDDRCRYNTANIGATEKGYVVVSEYDEDALKVAVATIGPISVAIDASDPKFDSYSEGVYFGKNCSSDIEKLHHAVLVVGYGTDRTHGDYWLVKNSWGTATFGDKGYIKMARNRNNNCGIATYATYPLVE